MDSIFGIIKGIGIGLMIVLIQADFLDNLNIVLIEGYDFLISSFSLLMMLSLRHLRTNNLRSSNKCIP